MEVGETRRCRSGHGAAKVDVPTRTSPKTSVPYLAQQCSEWTTHAGFSLLNANERGTRDPTTHDVTVYVDESTKGERLKRFVFASPAHRSGTLVLDICELDENIGYGHEVWRSAVALSIWMLEMASGDAALFLGNQDVLELGSGIGLPSLVIASLPSAPRRVEASDLSSTLASQFERNLKRNEKAIRQMCGCVHSRVINWDECLSPLRGDVEGVDIILGADIVYNPAHAKTLIAALETYLNPGGKFILMNPPEKKRKGLDAFLQELHKRGVVTVVSFKLLESHFRCWSLPLHQSNAGEIPSTIHNMDLIIFTKAFLCLPSSS